jgi:hypothetical protein
VTNDEGRQSAAATAAEKVRAIVEAAERSAAELEAAARDDAARIRADAERQAEARLATAREAAARIAERAAELERQVAAARASIASLAAELEQLRGSGAGPAEPAPAAPAEEAAARLAASPVAREEEAVDETIAAAEAAAARAPDVAEGEPAGEAPEHAAAPGSEGARVIALNMALGGTPREETARYLAENFELDDPDALLDDVYARASGQSAGG